MTKAVPGFSQISKDDDRKNYLTPISRLSFKDKPEWWPHVMSSITFKDMDLYMNQMDSAAACGMIQMVNGYISSVAIGNKTNC